MTKRTSLAAFLALLCPLVASDALAQYPYVYRSQAAPQFGGYSRKGPCGVGSGDSCGPGNPVEHHITPDQCGHTFSTSNARNPDGSVSTEGVRFTLPTVAELTAAGFLPSGASASQGFANREGQCILHFVQGSPGPANWLRLKIDGVFNVDKATFMLEGTFHDMHYGEVWFPFIGSAILTVVWNGTSIVAAGGSPSMMEQLGYGQMHAHGQGRLFLVTADPSWWTAGTKVGSLAYCPNLGRGTTIPTNGGIAMHLLPPECAYLDPLTTTQTVWVGLRFFGSVVATAIGPGESYGAGTAPDGRAYAAGTYVRVTASTSGMSSGNTLQVHDLPTTLGADYNAKWIIKVIDSTHFDLHEKVTEPNFQTSHIGPPSAYLTGDTIRAGAASYQLGGFYGLADVSTAQPRITNPATGVDEDNGRLRTIVGMYRREAGIGITDSTAKRFVSSMFNPVEKKLQCTTAADRTTTSASFVKVNTDMDCPFVYHNGINAANAIRGDQGRRLRWELTLTVSNNTAGFGCEVGVGFDGTTAEPETAIAMQPTGITNFKQTVTVSGNKVGLTDTNHTLSALVKTVGGGTCTVYSANSYNTSYHWQ